MKPAAKTPPLNRSQDDYLSMSHSVLLNHLQTEVKKSKGKPKLQRLTDYLTKRWISWLYYYVVNRFGPNHRYNSYPAGMDGIYPLAAGPTVICLAADWATDTPESAAIAACMKKHEPDYTIHLGDTYYVGAPHEIAANFTHKASPWPRGSKGSFAVLGNHEMYARGIAFFNKLLPTLGLFENGKYAGQRAGYFCLENKHWRILGLDTGFHSIGKLPLIEMLSWFAPDCHFDKKLMDWLRNEVRLDNPEDKRGLLILSHHQYISAFDQESEYLKPAEQLAGLIGTTRPVVWLFGHEHKFSMYEKAQVGGGITAYGRCIGHGGMPVEIDGGTFAKDQSKHGFKKLVMVDDRVRPGAYSCRLGYNGYAQLELQEAQLTIVYRDAFSELVRETWNANTATGAITGQIKADKKRVGTVPGKSWQDAVN